jgi:hypothetical protein
MRITYRTIYVASPRQRKSSRSPTTPPDAALRHGNVAYQARLRLAPE